MRFLHVKFVKPDAKQFDPPAGYTQSKAPPHWCGACPKSFWPGPPTSELLQPAAVVDSGLIRIYPAFIAQRLVFSSIS